MLLVIILAVFYSHHCANSPSYEQFLLIKASLQNREIIHFCCVSHSVCGALLLAAPANTGGQYNYPALHVETEAQREQMLLQPASGRQFVPESVFLTAVFKHKSVLSKQSDAFALQQSFTWAP